MELMTEMKGDIGARLNRLEARKVEGDQESVVSAGSDNFFAYAEVLTGLDCIMTLDSLKDEVTPRP